MLFDVWNPLWGSMFITWAPATIVIRGFMGFLLGYLRKIFPKKPRHAELLAMAIGATQKNLCYFLYDYILFGSAAYMDLITFFPLSVIDVALTLPLLWSLRRALKIDYLN